MQSWLRMMVLERMTCTSSVEPAAAALLVMFSRFLRQKHVKSVGACMNIVYTYGHSLIINPSLGMVRLNEVNSFLLSSV